MAGRERKISFQPVSPRRIGIASILPHLGYGRVPPIRVIDRKGAGVSGRRKPDPLGFGAIDIARKPNYDFERRERDRIKLAESAKKAQAKSDKRAAEQASAAPDPSDPSAGSDDR